MAARHDQGMDLEFNWTRPRTLSIISTSFQQIMCMEQKTKQNTLCMEQKANQKSSCAWNRKQIKNHPVHGTEANQKPPCAWILYFAALTINSLKASFSVENSCSFVIRWRDRKACTQIKQARFVNIDDGILGAALVLVFLLKWKCSS